MWTQACLYSNSFNVYQKLELSYILWDDVNLVNSSI